MSLGKRILIKMTVLISLSSAFAVAQVPQKGGVIMGVALTQDFIDQLGDVGSWYYGYFVHPNRMTPAGYVDTVTWANRYQKEYVPMVSGKRFQFTEDRADTCALIPEFRQSANDRLCSLPEMVAAMRRIQALFSVTNKPRFLIGFNEPFKVGAQVGGAPTAYEIAPGNAAKAWSLVQRMATQTGLKLISPSTSLETGALKWMSEFLKQCHDLRNSATTPCDVEKIYAFNTHGYECTEKFWVDNYGKKVFQNQLISRLGNYGGRDWRTYVMSRKVWATETSCNWDPDFRKAQEANRYVRSSKEACLRATGQRAGFGRGSLQALQTLPAAAIERYAWWTTYLNPYQNTDVNAITQSSINRIFAARLFDDDFLLTPVGRANFQALSNPSLLRQVNCGQPNHFIADHYRCEFTLEGARGHRWRTVRKTLNDDKCQVSRHSVELNNPNARIVAGPLRIFVGADNGLANKTNANAHTKREFWQCRFELQGPAGARWRVYRNTDVDDNCATAKAQVALGNPKARILAGPEKVYVGGDNGYLNPRSNAHRTGEYWECHFEITGAGGRRWKVIRRTDQNDNCAAATTQVRANNPGATISPAVKMFSGLDL